jgi:cobalamin biosynthesis Mg chelatase CobN
MKTSFNARRTAMNPSWRSGIYTEGAVGSAYLDKKVHLLELFGKKVLAVRSVDHPLAQNVLPECISSPAL